MRSIAVIGLGNYGSTVARELTERGAQVIAIDQDKDRVEAIKEKVAYAVSLNSTNREALQAAAVDQVDIAVVCIGDNVEASLLTALQLKKLGVRKIWARAINPLQHEILTALGVEEVVDLEEQMGMATARSLSSVNVSKHIPLASGHSIAEVRIPSALIGKTIRQINPRDQFSVNIIGIRTFAPVIDDMGNRSFEEKFDEVPSPDMELTEDMILLVAGNDKSIERFARG